MHKIGQYFSGGIHFANDPASLVQTQALATWEDFKNQRLRWASKWKVGNRPATRFAALAVLVLQLSQLYLIFLTLNASQTLEILLAVVFFKALAEYIFITTTRKYFGLKTSVIGFLLSFILYPFYALYFGLAGNFKNFEWKGRSYAPQTK